MSDRDPSIDRACTDAETLAMWADGALPASQAVAMEAHVADCARCQELVATFALTEPAAATATASVMPTRAPWLQRWWLPLAGGLAAASLLIFSVARRDGVSEFQVETQIAKVEAPATQPTAPLPVALPEPQPRSGIAAGVGGPAPKPSPAPARKRESAPKITLPTEPRGVTETMTAAAPAAIPTRAPAPMPAPPPPPPPPPAPVAMAQQLPPQGVAGGMVGGVAGGVAGGVVGGVSNSGVAGMRMERSASARDTSTATPIVEFASPGNRPASSRGGGTATMTLNVTSSPAITRWRVTTATRVERSTDNGRTWTTVDLGSAPVTITNGAAPSTQVCWLVGRGGLVLRSADGVAFARVTFPEPIDLVAITATDLLNATVTATGGRQFTTADGGLTWK